MKKLIVFLVSFSLLGLSFSLAYAQEADKSQTEEKKTAEIMQKRSATYDPAGRRDPFRDLLAGSMADETTGGIEDMSIEDIVLIGIAKVRDKYSAIIEGPQGFPHTVKVGDKFDDGFVLSIDSSKVVFRQTKERGVPLYRPKDITKEINPEER